jgi:drug/metabolite transporter (DMT)-like permease
MNFPVRGAPRLDGTTLALYAATVFVWGTSWIGIRMQLGEVAPEVSILWRFLIAAAVMLAWVSWRRQPMRFSVQDHLRLAALGILLFSTNFVLFYHAGKSIASGLLAVVFSLASIINLGLGAILLGQRIEPTLAAGGGLGVIGIALLFWPEIASGGFNRAAAVGLVFALCGTLSFCLGNVVSTIIQRRRLPVIPSTTWGMIYGCAALAALCFARNETFAVEPTWRYWLSLVYLAIPSSVIAFACYITLLRRIGAARAGYATVLFPIIALTVSTVVEGYAWTPLAAVGAMCALIGNGLVLARPASSPAPPTS